MHFYEMTEDGVQPRHFVPMAKDPSKSRASRVTDAKKAAKEGRVWYPSVTTVLNILDKPALVNWKVDKHLEQAFELRHLLNPDYDYWNKKVKAETQEALDAAPKAGTAIHEVLEDYLFCESIYQLPETELKIIKSVEDKLKELKIIPSSISKEEYFVNTEHGYAGCADLIVKDSDFDANWVIDYKSKQEAAKFKPGKMAYPEHTRQLASYGKAFFGDKPFRAANIFICLETGEIDFHEHEQSKIESGWLDFVDCLSIYKRNTYNPLEK